MKNLFPSCLIFNFIRRHLGDWRKQLIERNLRFLLHNSSCCLTKKFLWHFRIKCPYQALNLLKWKLFLIFAKLLENINQWSWIKDFKFIFLCTHIVIQKLITFIRIFFSENLWEFFLKFVFFANLFILIGSSY